MIQQATIQLDYLRRHAGTTSDPVKLAMIERAKRNRLFQTIVVGYPQRLTRGQTHVAAR